MNTSNKGPSWKLLEIWLSIPRSARLAFLWAILLGVSYLGWIKIIKQFLQ